MFANIAESTLGCGSRFTDTNRGMHVMVGCDNLIFRNKINSSRGSDGILPSNSRLTMSKIDKRESNDYLKP